jgi:hypothetical protein
LLYRQFAVFIIGTPFAFLLPCGITAFGLDLFWINKGFSACAAVILPVGTYQDAVLINCFFDERTSSVKLHVGTMKFIDLIVCYNMSSIVTMVGSPLAVF